MNKVSKNLKPIFIITILYVAVLAIFVIVKSMTVAEAMDYGKKGILVAVVLAIVALIFASMSKKD